MLKENILETIGNTPIVKLNRIKDELNLKGNLYAKIEFYSPGLSKKDRIAKYIIEKAINDGKIKKNQTVIERTSGNTGIGCAAVCALYGIPFIAVMSEGNTVERRKIIEMFNGKVHLVPKISKGEGVTQEDMDLVQSEYERLLHELDAFPVNQFYNEDNALAHYYTTAQEIINDVPNVDTFVDLVGTGGSFVGIAKRLKEYNKDIKCIKVSPDKINHNIQGGGYFVDIPFEEDGLCDDTIYVSTQEAIDGMNMLSTKESILGGISSGANLIAALKYLEKHTDSNIVFLINDVGLKYLSII